MSPRTSHSRPRPAPGPPLRLAAAVVLAACFADLGQRGTDTATSTTTTGSTTDPTTGAAPVCGDGLVEPPETCDLGPLNGDYGACKDSCLPAACGDGLVAPAEACDDGDDDPDDGCLPDCTLPRCGDGVVADGELCDDGNLDDTDACATTCRPVGCGDGVLQRGEECDHGDLNADDAACTPKCTKAACGDGLVGPGEACDPGVAEPPCAENCALVSCTANREVEPGEECQIGEPNCTDRCLLDVCGDGFHGPAEPCDDGNKVDGDGCSAACLNEVCGDGVQAPAEDCDDHNLDDGDGCSSTCERDAHFIFVTEEKFIGTFGTVLAADQKCQDSAAARMLPGTYRAWISFPDDPPATRLKKSDLPYILPGSHDVVAGDWIALVSGALAHPIDRTAAGTQLTAGLSCNSGDDLAWTHTRANGGPAPGNPCNSAWISNEGAAVAGLVHAADLTWTEGCPVVPCNQALRLYCVEQ